MSYLQISGLLTLDGEFVSNPFFVTDKGPSAPYPVDSSTLVAWVELLDKGDNLLSRTPVIVQPICAHPATADTPTDPVFVLSGLVSLAENTVMVRVNLEDKTLYELRAAETPATVEVDWSAALKAGGGQLKIHWRAEYENPKALAFAVFARPKGEENLRIQLAPWTLANEALVTLDELPGGGAELIVSCSDGIRTTDVISPALEIPDKGCRPSIYSPGDQAKLSSELPVRLWGSGFYADWQGYRESHLLVWSSSLQGDLGEGNEVWAMLQPGQHVISLTAGSGKKINSTEITVYVES